MGQDMKMEKETPGPKNPNVVVKKSALEEFLEEWGSWSGKRKAKKEEKAIHKEAQLSTGDRIRRKRKQNTKFMDSGFMLVLKMFAGLVDIILSVVMWVFSLVFSFKFWIVVGAIIYFFDMDIKTKVIEVIGEQKIEDTIESLEEEADVLDTQIESNSERINKAINGWKEQLDGISIEIKQKDGSVKTFGTEAKEEVQ
jgi:hypothetical protein